MTPTLISLLLYLEDPSFLIALESRAWTHMTDFGRFRSHHTAESKQPSTFIQKDCPFSPSDYIPEKLDEKIFERNVF